MILLPTVTLTGVSQPVSLNVQMTMVNRVILSNKSNMVIACSSGSKVVRIQPFSTDLLMLDASAIILLPETPLIASGVTPTMEMIGVAPDEVLGESFPAAISGSLAIVNINSTVVLTAQSNAGQPILLVPNTSQFNIGDTLSLTSQPGGSFWTIQSIQPGVSLTFTQNLTNIAGIGSQVNRLGLTASFLTGGSTDISDRVARLLGHVIVDTFGSDVGIRDTLGNSITIGQKTGANSLPVVMASDQVLSATWGGTVVTPPAGGGVFTIAAANAARKGMTVNYLYTSVGPVSIYNDDGASWMVTLPPGGYWEMPVPINLGLIQGYAHAANEAALHIVQAT